MRICGVVFALAVLALAVLGLAPTARAQADGMKVVVEPDRVEAAPKTFVDVTEVVIRGTKVKPSAVLVHPRSSVRFRNMIALRGSFLPELAKSSDHL